MGNFDYNKMSSEEKFHLIGSLSDRLFYKTGEPCARNLREDARYALWYLENEGERER